MDESKLETTTKADMPSTENAVSQEQTTTVRSAPTSATVNPTPATGYPIPGQIPVYSMPMYPQGMNPVPKKNKKLWIILTVAIVALLAVAAVLYFVILTPKVESITLSKMSAELKTGESQKITYQINPEKAADAVVTWSSSDANIATVDSNGMIIGCNVGNCVITATADGKTVSIAVTVSPRVDKITLSESEVSLISGDKLQLQYTIEPAIAANEKVTWKSSDPTVAVVDANGNVIAGDAGTCVITAIVAGKEAQVTITVDNMIAEERIVVGKWYLTVSLIDGNSGTFHAGDSDCYFNDDHSATLFVPDGSTLDFTWRYSYTEEDGEMFYSAFPIRGMLYDPANDTITIILTEDSLLLFDRYKK